MPSPSVPFRKMHALGNDFVILDQRQMPLPVTQQLITAMGDRRRGTGFDQLVVLDKPRTAGADVFMHLYNQDGSTTGACGNASRCVARLLDEEEGQQAGTLETVSGLLDWHRTPEGWCVDMGLVRLDWRDIPLAEACDTSHVPLTIDMLHDGAAVNVGNPHIVFFVEDATTIPLETLGRQVEHHPLFPQRINVEVVHVTSRNSLRMRVWERGAGITPACGSGACAAVVAAFRRGLCERDTTVQLDGGVLHITYGRDGHVLMNGGAEHSFTGVWHGAN